MNFSFDGRRGLIVVPAEVQGPVGSVVVRMALDTGATSTVVNVALLEAVGYEPALELERVEVTTGSGVESAPRMVLEKLVALGQERAGFAALGHTLPPSAGIDGVLGLDFFRERGLSIDFRAGQVTLK